MITALTTTKPPSEMALDVQVAKSLSAQDRINRSQRGPHSFNPNTDLGIPAFDGGDKDLKAFYDMRTEERAPSLEALEKQFAWHRQFNVKDKSCEDDDMVQYSATRTEHTQAIQGMRAAKQLLKKVQDDPQVHTLASACEMPFGKVKHMSACTERLRLATEDMLR